MFADADHSLVLIAQYSLLFHQEGKALTILRPSGIALINNKKYNVITGGDFIEKDTPVVVTKIVGSKIIVAKKK